MPRPKLTTRQPPLHGRYCELKWEPSRSCANAPVSSSERGLEVAWVGHRTLPEGNAGARYYPLNPQGLSPPDLGAGAEALIARISISCMRLIPVSRSISASGRSRRSRSITAGKSPSISAHLSTTVEGRLTQFGRDRRSVRDRTEPANLGHGLHQALPLPTRFARSGGPLGSYGAGPLKRRLPRAQLKAGSVTSLRARTLSSHADGWTRRGCVCMLAPWF